MEEDESSLQIANDRVKKLSEAGKGSVQSGVRCGVMRGCINSATPSSVVSTLAHRGFLCWFCVIELLVRRVEGTRTVVSRLPCGLCVVLCGESARHSQTLRTLTTNIYKGHQEEYGRSHVEDADAVQH